MGTQRQVKAFALMVLVCAACGHSSATPDAGDSPDGGLPDGALAEPDAAQADPLLPVCPPGFTRYQASPLGLPRALSPHDWTLVALPGPSPAAAMGPMAVHLGVDSRGTSSLDIRLLTPQGQSFSLSGELAPGASPRDVTFIDGAPRYGGQAQGTFAPLDPFVRAWDEAYDPDGTWQLAILSTDAQEGSLTGFTLVICACDDCEVGPACSDGQDSDADGDTDCADLSCSADPRCLPEAVCGDRVDGDHDGDLDCHDADCDGHDGCELGHERSCADGVDNDADGLRPDAFSHGPIDCNDSDCQGGVVCAAEASCSDGSDEDGDGLSDCADPGCARLAVCGGHESFCSGGRDDDGDGLAGCADPDCAGALACQSPACPAGDTRVVVESDQLPVRFGLLDEERAGVMVNQAGRVDRVAVQVQVSAPAASLVSLLLLPPSQYLTGTWTDLATYEQGDGADFAGTIFRSGAATSIADGSAPYSGSFQPRGDFAALLGSQARGVWQLDANGGRAPGDAAITGFTLELCMCTSCAVPELCDNALDEDEDGLADCADPDCAAVCL